MKVSDKGLVFIAGHEGIVPAPYFDSVGVLTYGIGHTAAAGAPNPASMARGMPADMDAALANVMAVFARDIERYAADVLAAVKVPMAQHEFDAAVSFHFNTGAIARASWVKHWNAGDRVAAGKAIMNWSKPPEIIPRRSAEQTLWRSGSYGSGKATVWPATEAGKVIWKPVTTLTQAQLIDLMQPAPPATEIPAKAPGLWRLIQLIIEGFRK
ncbi:lysozyme [Pseudooceanicola sp. C21-150M6]|uniref:lysozyme n=1 Tax=Pseudooceanicola sp. C21-150M6 TaxID=3434355 RepID=UPI003D7FAF7A